MIDSLIIKFPMKSDQIILKVHLFDFIVSFFALSYLVYLIYLDKVFLKNLDLLLIKLNGFHFLALLSFSLAYHPNQMFI